MDIFLHEKQTILDQDDHRFQVCAAGRRFGKSFYAAYKLYKAAAEVTKVRSDGVEISLLKEVVYYVGPTMIQAKENLWNVMLELGHEAGVIAGERSNAGELVLTNGRIIRFKGADDPDRLRGVGLSYCVMDEYAFMKPDVWQYIVRPALGFAEGGALFIGTPAGKNHFYDMWLAAENGKDPSSGKDTDDWKAFAFHTADNTYLPPKELEAMKDSLSEDAQKQELYASFEATGGSVFTMDMFPIVPWKGGAASSVIAVDLAGFSTVGSRGTKSVLDDHAIAIALIHDKGWHIQQVLHGKWDVRKTALQIIRAWRTHGKPEVGIERGMAKNAVCGEDGFSGYLGELMHKWGYFTVKPLTHGNQKKEDRIKWALQGRAEKGQITLEPDDKLDADDKWIGKFLSQAVDFPNHLAKDDLLDAVAYIDQMANTAANWDAVTLYDDWTPHDSEVGY